MLAAIIENGGLKLCERSRPDPGPGVVLIRTGLAAICGTDLELAAGYQNFSGIPGHEFVGRVVEAPQHEEWLGQRVVADINCGCGQCPRCRQNDPRHCPQRKVIGIRAWDGAFAGYLRVPVANLHPVPEAVHDLEAVFAEPLAAALEVSQQVHITAKTRVAVLGAGKLGLLAALALSRYAPGLTLFGRHLATLDLAAAQGVSTCLIHDELPPAEKRSSDLVVECTGRPEGLKTALDLVRPQGTVAVKTTSHRATEVDMSRVVVDEITLLGSRCGNLDLALHFLSRHWLDVRPLVQTILPLSQLQAAFDLARQPGTLKVVLDCSEQNGA